MNAKTSAFSTIFATLFAVIMLFANSFTVLAFPAEPPDKPNSTSPSLVSSVGCTLADIPSTRVDYLNLEDPSRCTVVAANSIELIPNTGLAASQNRYQSFKERQADLTSGAEFSATQNTLRMMDPRFAAFKMRQAEENSH